jgi:nitrogenase subunit NifH
MASRLSSWWGEAGIGKTRLVAELTARCVADGTKVLAGGCVPVGDGALPYAPIVEALRTLLACCPHRQQVGFHHRDPPAAQRARRCR